MSDKKGVVVCMKSCKEEDRVVKGGLLWVRAWAKALDIFWVGIFF